MKETCASLTIATTISPSGDLQNQQKAIASWLDMGFRVISVNPASELSKLKPFFSGVDFVPTWRDAAGKFERSFVYFDDILAALTASGSDICGIINSDIHLVGDGLASFISHQAEHAFLFGARLDVKSLDEQEKCTWFNGFDYFFFKREIIELYPPEEFCLGLPWWDYWAVLVPIAKGIPVKRIVTPIAYHLFHHSRYNLTSWFSLGHVLAKYFTPNFPLDEKTMVLYNYMMFDHIDRNPSIQQITMPE